MKRTVLIFIAIYLITFGIIAGYNLTHPIVNDGVNEYIEYNRNIAHGWEYRDSIVNSCVVTTWIPAMIHRITGFDKLILFKIFPAFLFSLMPAFTFLIARRYMRLSYAVIAAFVVIFSSTILYFPSVGRVGVALGFMAGLIWALLEKRYVWAGLFALAVVFSHYGASVIATGKRR